MSVYCELDRFNKNVVDHDTWGHLYPEKNVINTGMIRICNGSYSDFIIIQDSVDIDGSPWWFSSLNDFVAEFLADKEDCVIYDLELVVKSVKCEDDGERLDIQCTGYKTAIMPLG